MTSDEAEREAERLLPTVLRMAEKFCQVDQYQDDFRSAAGLALSEALTKYDPAAGMKVETYVYEIVTYRLTDEARRLFGKPGSGRNQVYCGEASLDALDDAVVPVRRGTSPAEAAIARETLKAIRASLPDPARAALKAASLRAAMFDAVAEQDIKDVMRTVVARAKDGDLNAAKMLLRTLGLTNNSRPDLPTLPEADEDLV